ncbi:biopolymer transporter ExbD [Longimicrobium sp.]|uniref:ExbD/TolR family protein n=1 Tax=Longimicrobium sp. TaxID=2029185 RepID=UPI002E350EF2|nr:biopolymer transporter ExbD [Longimicrobium sp.]HEX6041278.1 biopolymer transporter ExbD [Longimicrobium sp.]
MAMGIGGRKGGGISEINMTPMIDVLLVLLIIFMVVQQGLQRGLGVMVPPPRDVETVIPPAENLVLEVEPGGRYLLNRQPIPAGRLEESLARVFAERQRKVLFVKGAESIAYGDVVSAVDASRAAGVQVVGLVPLQAAR